MQKYFYATADDLLPVLLQVERRRRLSYIRAGVFDVMPLEKYDEGDRLPTLRWTAHDAAAHIRYLVTEADVAVQVRPIHLLGGGTRHAIDQLISPNSLIFTHGGLRGEGTLLRGSIGTVSSIKAAVSLYRAFARAIETHFHRVGGARVGPEAHKHLNRGCRLMQGPGSSITSDLIE